MGTLDADAPSELVRKPAARDGRVTSEGSTEVASIDTESAGTHVTSPAEVSATSAGETETAADGLTPKPSKGESGGDDR